jgi:hypothetical protein
MTTSTDDIIDYQREEASQNAYRYRQDWLQETIQQCARRLESNSRVDYVRVARTLQEVLPRLQTHASKPFDEYEATEADADDWYWDEFAQFSRSTGAVSNALASSDDPETVGQARQVLEGALSTTARIAEREGIIKGQYTKTAAAKGLSGRTIGRVYKDPQMPFEDEVEVTVEAGTIKSFFCGGTNTGKSTAAEGQFQDYYWRNFIDGKKPTKCIDPFDFSVAENIFYDVEQSDDDLRDALDEMDLPKDFSDTDLDPSLEVFVPLTRNLSDLELPYDTESDDDDAFVPRPFVIPASEISQDLFVSVLTARVSNSEADTLSEVYEAVDRERSDWRLEHLAQEVAQRDELSDKHQRKAIRVIQSLQDYGFIRQSPSEYELDWDRIFRDTETVTAFNQLLCGNKRQQLFVLAWILEQMWDARTQIARYPQMAMMLRELWAYAPQNRREEDDAICAALQERIVSLLTRYLRQNRDVRTHVIADTQNLRDINIGVRTEFNRYCLFQGKRWMAEKIFEWTGNDKVDSFVKRITPDVGECGITGVIGPAFEHSRIEYVAPVALAPPLHHHHDKDDGNGFLVRPELVDDEELRRPADVEGVEWPADLPSELQIPPPDELLTDDEGDEDGESSASQKEYHRHEARNRRSNGLSYRDIRRKIPNNPNTGNPYSVSTIKDWVDDVEPNSSTGENSPSPEPADD